jgi:hypothetical protein
MSTACSSSVDGDIASLIIVITLFLQLIIGLPSLPTPTHLDICIVYYLYYLVSHAHSTRAARTFFFLQTENNIVTYSDLHPDKTRAKTNRTSSGSKKICQFYSTEAEHKSFFFPFLFGKCHIGVAALRSISCSPHSVYLTCCVSGTACLFC